MTSPRNESFSSSAGSRVGDVVANAAGHVKDEAARYGQKVADEATRYGQKAADAVEAGREPAANAIEGAASGIRSTAEGFPGGRQVKQFANSAADGLKNTADYIRKHDASDMMADLQGFLKAYPTQALIGAAVVGFLVGRSMRSNRL